jgi:hypothetical protein
MFEALLMKGFGKPCNSKQRWHFREFRCDANHDNAVHELRFPIKPARDAFIGNWVVDDIDGEESVGLRTSNWCQHLEFETDLSSHFARKT